MATEMTEFDYSDFRDAILEAVDKKDVQTECLGVVTRTDRNEVVWVHLVGGESDTPVSRVSMTVQSGDLVRCKVENGRCDILDNLSSTGVSLSLLSGVVQAMTSGDMSAIKAITGDFEEINALRANVDLLLSSLVKTGYLEANYIDANAIRTNYLDAQAIQAGYLNVDFANLNAEQVRWASIEDLFTKSGIFGALQILGDGTITGTLNATLLNGNTARFTNIYADALKILGDDGLYRALNLRGLDEDQAEVLVSRYGESLKGGLHGSHILAESITADKINVTQLMAMMLMSQFVQIGASGGIHIESVGNRLSFLLGGYSLNTAGYIDWIDWHQAVNPMERGWYVLVDEPDHWGYVRTTDTYVHPDTMYYVNVISGNLEWYSEYTNYLNPVEEGWYELDGSDYVLTEDTTFDETKDYYAHISRPYITYVQVTPEGFEDPMEQGWYEMVDGQYVLTSDTVVDSSKAYFMMYSDLPSDKAVDGEVAFISVDNRNQSVFYMTNEIILKTLRFGKWMWFERSSEIDPDNTNMALKWVG